VLLSFAGYQVFYTTDATYRYRDWVRHDVPGDRLSTTIRDLSPQTMYYFKTQARNNAGYGPMSPTVVFRTPSGAYRLCACRFVCSKSSSVDTFFVLVFLALLLHPQTPSSFAARLVLSFWYWLTHVVLEK